MEHTYYTCDRCQDTFKHKDVINSVFVVFPKPKPKEKVKSPFESMMESSKLVMIPLPGMMPSPPKEEKKWPDNWKELCPECQIELVRWWNKELVVEKRYV